MIKKIKKIKDYFSKKSEEGSKIPYIIVVFFLVIITVNVVYILIAIKSWRGVSVDNSYQKGIEYNETLKLKEKQKELGWSVEYKYKEINEEDGIYNAYFVFFLLDSNKFPINDANFGIQFSRSDKPEYNFFENAVADRNNSRYTLKTSIPLKGKWEVEFFVKKDENEFREKRKFVIE